MLKRKSKQNKHLVFTSAGDNANLEYWIKGNPKFDLFIYYYGDQGNRYSELTPLYVKRKGGKFSNLYHLVQSEPDILKKYTSALIMDDDVIISCRKINELFHFHDKHDLWLSQPAFNPKGKWSYHTTLQQSRFSMRVTNFVEMTCPVFNTAKLMNFLQVFDPSLCGWGTDYWYSYFMSNDPDYSDGRIAIVDKIPCVNPHDKTKPGGLREINNLQSPSEGIAQWKLLSKKFGLPEEIQPTVTKRYKREKYYRGFLRLKSFLRCRRA